MKKAIFLFIVLIVGSFIIVPATSLAQTTPPTIEPPASIEPTKTVTPSTAPSVVRLENPLPTSDVPTLIGQVIKGILGIVGSLALVMFIYGGFTWMLAGGNTETVTKGRNIIVWAAIGLVVIFTSYALVNFVITSLTSS